MPEQDRIAEVLAKYTTSPELELQQRAVEFASLFSLGEMRIGVLEQMPPPELKATVMGVVSENKPVGSTKGKEADLLGDEAVPPTPVNGQPTATVKSNQDLLAEIFGPSTSISSTPATTSSPPMQTQRSKVDDILNLFGPSSSLPSAPTTAQPSVVSPSYTSSLFTPTQAQSPPTPAVVSQPQLTSYTAYDKNDVKITLTPQTSAARPGVVMILARFQVSGGVPATSLSFQAAVPKSQQLQMLPMSNPVVNPGAVETQQMRVVAPAGSNVRLRLRIAYSIAGQSYQDQVDFAGFPPNLTSTS